MKPIYLRKEPTVCPYTLQQRARMTVAQRDVVAYDSLNGAAIARWSWDRSDKPTRRNKSAMFNCVSRPVIWLPDMVPA